MKKTYLATVLLAAIGNLAAPFTASAGQTPWFETDGGNVRVIMEPIEKGAKTARGVIDIQLVEGWKTYWRDPGSGGIPPSIQPTDKLQFTVSDMRFPAPVMIESQYGDHASYDAPVQIPFVINAAGQMREEEIAVRLMVGICEEICIPAFTDLSLPISFATGTTAESVAVQNAINALPSPPSDLGLSIEVGKADAQKFKVTVSNLAGDLELFISGAKNEQFKAPILLSKNNDSSRTYLVEPLRAFTAGQEVNVFITGRTPQGDFETVKLVKF